MNTASVHAVIMAVPRAITVLKGREKNLALSRFARQALTEAARYSGISLTELEKGPQGQPIPENGMYWSLSHANAYVAATAAPCRVGIDIEVIKPIRTEVIETVFDTKERALKTPFDATRFCRFWTAKEAVLKAAGVGLRGLDTCRIARILDARQLEVRYDDKTWIVSQAEAVPNHIASISIPKACVTWHFCE